jgi:hypothetical protein
MKRLSLGSVVAGVLALVLASGWSWGKKEAAPSENKASTGASASANAASAAAQPDEKIVHTFSNDDDVKAFAGLWQQRQGIITRMAVLRAYWSEEQARLNEMDTQLTSSYKLDLKKRHILSQERKVLIELEALPEASAPVSPQSSAAPTDSSGS